MGMMSGMTANTGNQGGSTIGSGAHDSKLGTYSGIRSSGDPYGRGGKATQSMRPGVIRGSGMEAY